MDRRKQTKRKKGKTQRELSNNENGKVMKRKGKHVQESPRAVNMETEGCNAFEMPEPGFCTAPEPKFSAQTVPLKSEPKEPGLYRCRY